MDNAPLLRSEERAQAGQQDLKGVLWDAVFAVSRDGSRLLAYVDGSELAEFFAQALNHREGK